MIFRVLFWAFSNWLTHTGLACLNILEPFCFSLCFIYQSFNNSRAAAQVQMVQLDVLFILLSQIDLLAECQNLICSSDAGRHPHHVFIYALRGRGQHYAFILFWTTERAILHFHRNYVSVTQFPKYGILVMVTPKLYEWICMNQ